MNRKLDVALGTALWGWGINKRVAFELLDVYVENGYELIDTATNYPINSQIRDRGLVLKWLEEWKKTRETKNLRIYVKVGSLDNYGSSKINLSQKYLEGTVSNLVTRFEDNLFGIGIHWDNRQNSTNEKSSIIETIEFFRTAKEKGLEIGFSGVKNLDFYKKIAPDLANSWLVQVKENLFDSYQQTLTSSYFPHSKFFAYGINAGGIKLENNNKLSSLSLRGIRNPDIEQIEVLSKLLEKDKESKLPAQNFNQLSIKHIWNQEIFKGLIIGPRTTFQLTDSLEYISKLKNQY